MYDYLIVGAGLFGAVFAHEATKAGRSCLVVDRRSHIGGNCYTREEDGIHVHQYGAHIFRTSRPEVWAYVNRFAEFNQFVNSPIAVSHGRVFNLPFNMNTFRQMWGVSTVEDVKRIIKEQSQCVKEIRNLEDKAISLVGRDIYETLIKGYTEKQWGMKCTELPASIISRIPVRFTYDNNYYNDLYQFIPVGGYNSLISKFLEGSHVILSVDFNKEKHSLQTEADKIVYTGRIDSLFDYKYGVLPYRSLKFKLREYNTKFFQECAVVNNTEADVPFTRSIEHKYFDYACSRDDFTLVSFEYPDGYAGMDDKEAYYPVNIPESEALHSAYLNELKEHPNIIIGGRLAEYKYYDMDDTILSAMNLWKEVNKC